jgi:hypothetical protein
MTSCPGKELTSPSLAENPDFARKRPGIVGDVLRTLRVAAHATDDEPRPAQTRSWMFGEERDLTGWCTRNEYAELKKS